MENLLGRFGGENPRNNKVIMNSSHPSDIKLKVSGSHHPTIINLRMCNGSNPCVVCVITIIQFMGYDLKQDSPYVFPSVFLDFSEFDVSMYCISLDFSRYGQKNYGDVSPQPILSCV